MEAERIMEAVGALEQMRAAKETAYRERNLCVAAIARFAVAQGLVAGFGKHDETDTTWEADWRHIVFIDLPTGQVSWHIHDSEVSHFGFLGAYDGKYDGHSTPEKYRRLAGWFWDCKKPDRPERSYR